MKEINQVLEQLREDIQLRGYSKRTEHEYILQAKAFLEYTDCPPEELTEEHFRKYLTYLLHTKRLSPETVNTYNCCIRFLYEVTLKYVLNTRLVPRMREHKKIPQILNQDEMARLFSVCTNLKHKSVLMLAYGSGLRVSEITHLKIQDIQSDTMRVFVNCGKCRKDRYTILSESCLLTLRAYYKQYRPKEWLFEGRIPGEPMSTRAAQMIFTRTLEKSGITKKLSIHSLRHAFATHLLDCGANLAEVRLLLGHSYFQSTSRYIHLQLTREGIKSPLDSITTEKAGN